VTEPEKTPTRRRYPALYERAVPIILAVLALIVVILLVVILGVVLGKFPLG
jgi:hypothetical protein